MKACVIGLGYIGFPAAILIASKNVQVHGFDVNVDLIEALKNNKTHIVEEGLQSVFDLALKNQCLTFDTKPIESDVYIVAVPTPFKNSDTDIPKPDLSFIDNAVNSISMLLKPNDLLIIESTCPVGTTNLIAKNIKVKRNDLKIPTIDQKPNINIAYCPERVLPGNIIHELINNDRVIGGLTEHCTNKAKSFYELFVSGSCFETNAKTAEFVKLSENSYRDVQIAFANQLSIIASKEEIDISELIALSNKHPRVNILDPGPGVGGHCIPVDPWFLVDSYKKDADLIHLARVVNMRKTEWVIEKIKKICTNLNSNLKIGILGLTYKPNSDDIRESPSIMIASKINQLNEVSTFCYDPYVEKSSNISTLKLKPLEFIINDCDLVFKLVDHHQFKGLKVNKERFYDFSRGS